MKYSKKIVAAVAAVLAAGLAAVAVYKTLRSR